MPTGGPQQRIALPPMVLVATTALALLVSARA